MKEEVLENNDYNSEKFRKEIIKLKGGQTYEEFAQKCGISRSHLSRLMSGNATQRPGKEVLRRIADATGEDYESLLIICGYATSPAKARKLRSFEERISLNVEDIYNGFSVLTEGAKIYKSLEDFMENYLMLYSYENCKFAFGKSNEYEGDIFHGAENYITVALIFDSIEGTCYTYAVLYYSETKGGKYVMQGAAVDGKSLLEVNFLKDETIKRMNLTKEEIAEMPYVTYVIETTEQKLLRSIFSDDDAYPYTEVGVGINVTMIPKNTTHFIFTHKNSLSQKEYDDFKLNDFTEECEPEQYFKGMSDNESCTDGYPVVLAAIMRSETGLPYIAMESSEIDVDGRNEISIFCPDTDASNQVVVKASSRYAKELGLSEYGEQIIFTTRYKDKQFKVEE